MSENLFFTLLTVAINGAVTWGVVSTKLAWMRQDIDDLRKRTQWLERREAGS